MLSRDEQQSDESQTKKKKLKHNFFAVRTHYRGCVGGAYVRLDSESRKEIDNKDHLLLFRVDHICSKALMVGPGPCRSLYLTQSTKSTTFARTNYPSPISVNL